MRRLHLRIRGRVQGVAFRAHAVRQARQLGLAGWVRNEPGGSVELVAEGEEPELGRLVAWCRQGPPAAQVVDLEEEWLEHVGDLGGFSIRYT